MYENSFRTARFSNFVVTARLAEENANEGTPIMLLEIAIFMKRDRARYQEVSNWQDMEFT